MLLLLAGVPFLSLAADFRLFGDGSTTSSDWIGTAPFFTGVLGGSDETNCSGLSCGPKDTLRLWAFTRCRSFDWACGTPFKLDRGVMTGAAIFGVLVGVIFEPLVGRLSDIGACLIPTKERGCLFRSVCGLTAEPGLGVSALFPLADSVGVTELEAAAPLGVEICTLLLFAERMVVSELGATALLGVETPALFAFMDCVGVSKVGATAPPSGEPEPRLMTGVANISS